MHFSIYAKPQSRKVLNDEAELPSIQSKLSLAGCVGGRATSGFAYMRKAVPQPDNDIDRLSCRTATLFEL